MRRLLAISIYGYTHITDIDRFRLYGRVANFFLDQSIGIDEINTFQLTFFSSMKIVGATDLGVMDVRVGVASSRDKLALRTRLRNLNRKPQFFIS